MALQASLSKLLTLWIAHAALSLFCNHSCFHIVQTKTDVACYPLVCESGVLVQTQHVQCAREMAAVAAKNMALAAAAAQYAPQPCIQLKFLQFSWTFYGVAEGNNIQTYKHTNIQTCRTKALLHLRSSKTLLPYGTHVALRRKRI
jgi:hypothetical protein